MSVPIHLSSGDFREKVLESELPVVIDFWAEWCAPCHRVAPLLEELAAQHAGRAVIAKVDVDAEQGLAREWEIRSIPTLLFVRDGKVVDRVAGALSRTELFERFEAFVAGSEEVAA